MTKLLGPTRVVMSISVKALEKQHNGSVGLLLPYYPCFALKPSSSTFPE